MEHLSNKICKENWGSIKYGVAVTIAVFVLN